VETFYLATNSENRCVRHYDSQYARCRVAATELALDRDLVVDPARCGPSSGAPCSSRPATTTQLAYDLGRLG
jgi:hypothetical protein